MRVWKEGKRDDNEGRSSSWVGNSTSVIGSQSMREAQKQVKQ